ncbi:MAG: TIGR03067 domain-containing protein [Planctomycetota bacterium]|nr:TIGR03067 domain-containing protein [Planctomycetota bacterium]
MSVLGSVLLANAVGLFAQDRKSELERFAGRWHVVELVEDGKVIPKSAIEEWLPSGGYFEVADNAIVYKSTEDDKKHVKVFSIDATEYPHQIDISVQKRKAGTGIYKFDDGKLVICLVDPEEGKRPTEFSAKEGTERMLMVLERLGDKNPKPARTERANPPKSSEEGAAARILTDAEVTDMLKGTWKYTDSVGALYSVMEEDGTFRVVREVKEFRRFQKMFVQTPISSGTWQVKNGSLRFRCTESVHPDRVGQTMTFDIRSISSKDMIFIDYMGKLGQASKVK